MSFGHKPQGTLNAFFPKGEMAALGVHTLNVIGSGIFANKTVPPTGVPTGVGSGGVPEVSATYVATGIYSIKFPSTKSVDVDAWVSSTSGYNFDAYVNNVNGVSGTAQLEIVRSSSGGTIATGAPVIQASGFLGFLPTGTKVNLQFFAAPVADGITVY